MELTCLINSVHQDPKDIMWPQRRDQRVPGRRIFNFAIYAKILATSPKTVNTELTEN
jgi:hypothetical protein